MNINCNCHQVIFTLAVLTLAAACNTVPTTSSSSTSAGSPPPTGSPGTSSSSSGSASSSSGTAGSASQAGAKSPAGNSAGSGQSGAQPGDTPGNKSAAQGGAEASGGSGDGKKSTAQDAAGKSEDEILADALGEFDRGMQQAQQGTATQDGEKTAGATGSGKTPGTGQGELTDAEKAGTLDAQLNSKFARFDDLMLGEREKVARSNNEQGSGQGTGDGEGDGEGEGYGDDPMQTAMANDPLPPRGSGFPGDKVRDDISPAPADVGDGQDDDIIARQLREAAQKEQDPELRAKLWEEYRKYKKGA